ncbi:MAG: nucleoside transporter C-terminal domain-containing protein [Desulfosalsimonas sp.]
MQGVTREGASFVQMSRLPAGEPSRRSLLIMSYALCGFANPGSLGIMIGGLGGIAPQRRGEIVSLGFRSLVAGTMAACMTEAMAGVMG